MDMEKGRWGEIRGVWNVYMEKNGWNQVDGEDEKWGGIEKSWSEKENCKKHKEKNEDLDETYPSRVGENTGVCSWRKTVER